MTSARPYIPNAGKKAEQASPFSRDRKRQLQIWWREIDRWLLALVLGLMVLGSIAVMAASPASANRLSTSATTLDELYFFMLHIRWQVLGVCVLVATSLLPQELARRGAILLGGAMLFALLLVPLIGFERNGATRWLDLGIAFQPSEFLKPAFAVLLAWILSWKIRDPSLPVVAVSAGLLGFIVVLLMAQPNLGAAILFVGCWFVLVMLAGLPMKRIFTLTGAGVGLLVLAYLFYDNARNRIDAFFGGGTAYDDRIIRARLAQAFGRIIRSKDDHGNFVILSPAFPSRLFTASPDGTPIERMPLEQALAEKRIVSAAASA